MATQAVAAASPPSNNTSTSTGLVAQMATRYGMIPSEFQGAISKLILAADKSGVVPSTAEVMICLAVANEHQLNPFTKEIHFFRDNKAGRIISVVGVDGWIKLGNLHPMYDGDELIYEHNDKGGLVACTSKIYRKDRTRPIVRTEYLSECQRDTNPWKGAPHRMLGHRALIQGMRAAFGFAGIMDEEDYERMVEWERRPNQPGVPALAAQPPPKPRNTAQATEAMRKPKDPPAQRNEVQEAHEAWDGLTQAEPVPTDTDNDRLCPVEVQAEVVQPKQEPGELFGLAITFQDPWDNWCHELCIQKQDSQSPLVGYNWEQAAAGSRNGKRHRALQFYIGQAQKIVVEQKKGKVSVFEQKCARALIRLQNRLEEEEAAGAQQPEDGTLFGSEPRDDN